MDRKPILWIAAGPTQPIDCGLGPGLGQPDARDPERALAELAHRHLPNSGSAEPSPGGLGNGSYACIIMDFPIPGWTPAQLLERVRQLAPGVPVVVRDPQGIRDPHGALTEPLPPARTATHRSAEAGVDRCVAQAIEETRTRDLARLAEQVGREDWERLLVGESPEMRQVSHLIRMVGARRSTVLITGETGTGKEVAARALHLAGPRRRVAMVAVNCSALPENLLEAELFGHVKGAFTGALHNRIGRFEQAQGGTIFLDEIGELPLDLQAKLLRVLQEREFQRLGSSETLHADVRVVAATNSDLPRMIEEGRFREDLYYRVNVVPIRMPALRQRPGDIPMLALHFLERICALEDAPLKSLDPEAIDRLCAYSWPGNVRQLENAIEMAVALSGERRRLAAEDFPLASGAPARTAAHAAPVVSVPDDGLDYEQTLARIERSILEQALRKTGGNKKAAAEMLRLKRTTLSAKMRSLDAAACN